MPSITTRLTNSDVSALTRAASILRSTSMELHAGETVNGKWDDADEEVHRAHLRHDAMLETAEHLSRIIARAERPE